MKQVFSLLILFVSTMSLSAQSLWTSAELEKKINKECSAFMELEHRTQHAWGTERVSSSVGLEYELSKYLKTQAAYVFIYRQSEDEWTKKDNFIPAYWSPRHRATASMTASYKWKKRIEVSLREQYQYTYRYPMFVPKYSPEGFRIPYEEVSEKHKHILKSRLEVKYDIKKSPFEPYISCELYQNMQGFAYEKMRYTLGTTYKINKKHRVECYYRYIDHSDDDEIAGSVLGIGYRFKW